MTWIWIFFIAAFIFICFWVKRQHKIDASNYAAAMEELEALQKRDKRYHLTPEEWKRMEYLKAITSEYKPPTRYQGGSAAGAAAMMGLAAYTIYQCHKDLEGKK